MKASLSHMPRTVAGCSMLIITILVINIMQGSVPFNKQLVLNTPDLLITN